MERGSWRSDEYVEAWAADDVLDAALSVPRRLTAELVAASRLDVRHVVDLGAGTGGFLGTLLERFPTARGTWVDASEPMLALARERLEGDLAYVVGDVGDIESLALERAQVVVTSRIVHDLPPETHARLYAGVYELLEPGGFFFNVDHVAVPPGWDAWYRALRATRDEPLPPHRDHPLASLDEHLSRIEAAGFESPEVPWRLLGTVLLAARRPL